MSPVALVTMALTYLVGPILAPAANSHPQALAAGKDAALLVWYTSVTLVLHCDAASITSDTFARTV
jgi:hypothetical protein